MKFLLIPKQFKKSSVKCFESSRGSTIVERSILKIWTSLQSSNPGALKVFDARFFKLFGYVLIFSYSLLEGTLSFTLSGNPAPMTINTATAGQNPNSAVDTSRTYGLITDLAVTNITAKINSSMPSNISLAVSLAAPSGATSLGSITLTTTAQNLVTGIPILSVNLANAMTYTLSATANAAAVTNATVTVTYTIQ